MSTLSPDQWQALGPYLDRALTLSEEERARWLESLRQDNPVLAEQVETLLREHRAAEKEGFLAANPKLPPVSSGQAGQTLGAYRLISPIGQGGMGTVWLAERSDGRFERRVAVKLLSIALVEHGGARFRREGSILGRLSHPHIAGLLDAGITAEGRPYLVLEYVEGEPVDRYCDQNKLDVSSRLELFLDVLDAVAHAHTNLIVHRDIKPSNVLVGKDGQVKLLDFGIAKLLEGEGREGVATLLTREAGSALTPAYAAPEQIMGAAVTTATDVYGLGVLLYMLLTGQHPAGPEPHSPADLVKAIVDTDPPCPSRVVAETNTNDALNRGATAERLRRQLRGDLDTVVTKALKKNPSERYPSVSALSDDLRRYLGNEPISARPDTMAYRAAKFVRRNRAAVTLATLVVVATVAGLVGTLLQARAARTQRDFAFSQLSRAERIAEFMTGVFKVSNPEERVGSAVTAREVLDNAVKDIETGLSKDPELQARMMYQMGLAYLNLGLFARAQTLFEGSIRAANNSIGPENRQTLKTTQRLAWTLFNEGKLPEAEVRMRSLLEIESRVLGRQDAETVGVMGDLATILHIEGHLAEAEKMQREVLEAQKRLIGPEAHYTLISADNLAHILFDEGRAAEAEKLEQETLETQRRVYGAENLTTFHFTSNYAAIKAARGADEEAERILRQLLDQARRFFGPNQPETAVTIYNLGALAAKHGRRNEAFSLLGQAVDVGLPQRVASGMEMDPDLNPLQGDPRFAAMVVRAKKRSAAQSRN